MNPDDVSEAVVQSILQDFQRELRRGCLGFLFRFPSEGYVKQFAKLDKRGRLAGEVIRRWHITASEVEEMHPEDSIPEPGRRGLNCYPLRVLHFACRMNQGLELSALAMARSQEVGVDFLSRRKTIVGVSSGKMDGNPDQRGGQYLPQLERSRQHLG